MTTRISAHQPMYLPYPGFFNKIKSVDKFVLFDGGLYSRGYYYNRNKIKGASGELMLTVPLIKPYGKKLNEIKIANNTNWQKTHMKMLYSCYSKSDFFKDYKEFFEGVYNSQWQTLHELNMKTLFYLMDQLDIDTLVCLSSDLGPVSIERTERIIDICKMMNADVYLSGIRGKDYLDATLFEKNNIKLEYQNYVLGEYKQLWGEFIPNLSIIDLLFNIGKKASGFI